MKPMPFTRFCGDVLNITLEPAQRVFYAVAGGEVQPRDLDGSDKDLAHEIFGAVDEVPSTTRYVVAALKGADIGWSFLAGARCLWRAVTAARGDAAAGEIRPALIVAPDLRLGRGPVRVATGFAESVPAIARMIHSNGSDSLVLAREGGWYSSVDCLPATIGGRATRGRRYLEVFLDEASFFRDDQSGAVNDVHTFNSLVVRCIGTTWLGSTPWLESSLIWKTYEANFGNPQTALAARLPTLLVRANNPRTRAMVERQMERDPEGAALEYGCQVQTGGSGLLFGPELLATARTTDVFPEIFCTPGGSDVVAGDLGLVTDATAFAAVRSDGHRVTLVDLLEMRPQRGQPLKLSEVVKAGCEFASRHGNKKILVDHHVLEPAREHLPEGFTLQPVEGGQQAKEHRHLAVRDGLRESRIRVASSYNHVLTQLASVTAKPQPGGGLLIQMPRRGGSHGDAAAATILALSAALRPGMKSLPAAWWTEAKQFGSMVREKFGSFDAVVSGVGTGETWRGLDPVAERVAKQMEGWQSADGSLGGDDPNSTGWTR